MIKYHFKRLHLIIIDSVLLWALKRLVNFLKGSTKLWEEIKKRKLTKPEKELLKRDIYLTRRIN